jgi:hypothetical protein
MTEIIKIDRETIIEHLTGSMFDFMENDAEYRWLLCQVGFKGYQNMTDKELIQEYREYVSEDPEEKIIIELGKT